MFEILNDGPPRIRLRDHHGHRMLAKRSDLRPGHLAVIARQRVIFLSDEDVVALAEFLDDYLEERGL